MVRLPAATCWNSPKIEFGKRATMPIKMIREMPLPIPRSVINSPSHMISTVPAVRPSMVMKRKPKPGLGTISSVTAAEELFRLSRKMLTPKACRTEIATVP